MGRSHGIHAEPTTFGVALAGHFAEIGRARERLARCARRDRGRQDRRRRRHLRAPRPPRSRAWRSRKLGLAPETVATQIVARDRHAAVANAMAQHGRRHRALRHQRAPLAAHRGRRGRGVLQPGPEGLERHAAQAQPDAHREPVRPGARRARGVPPALWRTSRSGTSATSRTRRSSACWCPTPPRTLAFMLDRTRGVIEKLVVYPERLRAEPRSHRRPVGQRGHPARAWSARAWAARTATCSCSATRCAPSAARATSAALLKADADIRARLGAEEIDAQFDLEHALEHTGAIIDRALASFPT